MWPLSVFDVVRDERDKMPEIENIDKAASVSTSRVMVTLFFCSGRQVLAHWSQQKNTVADVN